MALSVNYPAGNYPAGNPSAGIAAASGAEERSRGAELLWPGVIAAAAVGSSLTFACVAPFAAFAALLVATMAPRRAALMMAGVWAANQAVGFAVLGYPQTLETGLWGLAIAGGAMLGLLAAMAAQRALASRPSWLRVPASFVAAFAAYEVGLLAVALVLGGAENFAPSIVWTLAQTEAVWLAGLLVVAALLKSLGLMPGEARRAAA